MLPDLAQYPLNFLVAFPFAFPSFSLWSNLPQVFSPSNLTLHPASTPSICVLPSLIPLKLLFLRQVTHVLLYNFRTSLFSSIFAIIFFICFIQLMR